MAASADASAVDAGPVHGFVILLLGHAICAALATARAHRLGR